MLKWFIRRQLTVQPDTHFDSRDPLSHPLIKRMSPRELADLPLNRR